MTDPASTSDPEIAELVGRPRGRKRRRYQLIIGVGIAGFFVLVAVLADFVAPYDYREQSLRTPMAPATVPHFRDAQGGFHLRPQISAQRMTDPLLRTYTEDPATAAPLHFFVRGYPYHLLGIIPCERHLFGVENAASVRPQVNLLGTDELGRDRFSRLVIASRFSLIVGPVGALLAAIFGIILGATASQSGRLLDGLLMRAADAMMALPALVLILAARAAFPLELPPRRAATLMIGIFLAVGWAEVARLSRGLIKAVMQREYITAARALGLSGPRIFLRHILPNVARPLVVQFTVILPSFLLAETALSFLGVGLQEPEPSWGNMLAAASDLTQLQAQPFILLAPAFAILVLVIGVRLISEGMKSRG
jgi:peptide/nickel transport system permease protein